MSTQKKGYFAKNRIWLIPLIIIAGLFGYYIYDKNKGKPPANPPAATNSTSSGNTAPQTNSNTNNSTPAPNANTTGGIVTLPYDAEFYVVSSMNNAELMELVYKLTMESQYTTKSRSERNAIYNYVAGRYHKNQASDAIIDYDLISGGRSLEYDLNTETNYDYSDFFAHMK